MSGGLFGVGASVDAVAQAEEGKLVARPTGLLGALKLTLFESPSVYVERSAGPVRLWLSRWSREGARDHRVPRCGRALATEVRWGSSHERLEPLARGRSWASGGCARRKESGSESEKRESSSVAIVRISSWPKRMPMHVREPPPKGM